ncbi:hypothetical protein Nepgr_011549 [Nepenthes gracilis]|uniref:Uncharacterized protein n=1 Tax=Nepenthes gracilis TaxID=150966 RepID=A0AAD3SED9_NEPGR|nr:hypothetical protein Nepgr_011549 [Nepenthes gracilis]
MLSRVEETIHFLDQEVAHLLRGRIDRGEMVQRVNATIGKVLQSLGVSQLPQSDSIRIRGQSRGALECPCLRPWPVLLHSRTSPG